MEMRLDLDIVRILLVERTRLLRDALASVLSGEDGMEVVAAVDGLDKLVPFARQLHPDVAIVDVDLLTGPGLGAVEALTGTVPGCAVLVLADPDGTGPVRAAWDAHVRAFVSTETSPGRLAECIRRTACGERVIDPALAVAAMRAPRNPLTAREREVLGSVALGLPSTEIADRLCLTKGTVCNYVSTIIRNAGARNRLEAVRIAEECGWLPESGRPVPTRSR